MPISITRFAAQKAVLQLKKLGLKAGIIHYKLAYKGKYADVNQQFSLRWDDPKLNIKWPLQKWKRIHKAKLSYIYSKPILSGRDKKS